MAAMYCLESIYLSIYYLFIKPDPYISVGCYVDSTVDRAMPSFISNYNGVTNSEAVRLCYVDTVLRGWNVFGVQNGSSCWSGSKAGQTYNKHGRTSSCSAGTLANSVYVINGISKFLAQDNDFPAF